MRWTGPISRTSIVSNKLTKVAKVASEWNKESGASSERALWMDGIV